MRHSFLKSRPTRCLLVLVFLLMFVLSSLTPLSCDDYTYCFSWADQSRITSLSQIVPSMLAHRESVNGRIVPHAIVQLVLMAPKVLFNVLNALNIVVLCLLLRRFLGGITDLEKMAVLLVFLFFLWVFMPVFSAVFLWLDGAVNYSWGMSFLFLFLMPFAAEYLDLDESNKNIKKPLWFLYVLDAFLAGSYSENASLTFLAMAGCLMLLNWKKRRRFPILQFLMLLSAAAGYWVLLTAPATSSRAIAPSFSLVGFQIREILSYAKSDLIIPWCIFAGLFALSCSFRASKNTLLFSALLFLGNIASLAAYAFAVYVIPRHLFCSIFLTAVACFVLLGELIRLRKPLAGRMLLACLSVLFLISFAEGILDIAVTFHKSLVRESDIQTALAAGETSISLEVWHPYSKYAIDFPLDTGENPYVWPNTDVAAYYGFDAVYGVLPKN